MSATSSPPPSPSSTPHQPPVAFSKAQAGAASAVKDTVAQLRLKPINATNLGSLKQQVTELRDQQRRDEYTIQSLQEQLEFLDTEIESVREELEEWRQLQPPTPLPIPIEPPEQVPEPKVINDMPPPVSIKPELKSPPRVKTKIELMVEDLARGMQHLPSNFKRLEGDRFQFGTKKLLLTVVGQDVMVSVGGGYWKFTDYVERFGDDEEKKWQVLLANHARRQVSNGCP